MSCNHALLTIPREVRDEIYSLLLDSSDDPPLSPNEAGLRYEEVTHDRPLRNRRVYYPPPTTCKGPTSALSQCNRQLRHEIVDFITKTHLTKGGTCELDVMVKGCMLWPTWTKLLHSVVRMEHLEVNLRLFNFRDGGGVFWGDGGPGSIFVVLFRLLNRLLHHGPRFLYSDGDNQSLELQTLTLNVLPGYGEVLSPDDAWFKDEEDPVAACNEHLEPTYKSVYHYISWQLDRVVRQGLLSDKVRTLKVCYNDRVKMYVMDDITPSATPPDEWTRWGFVWGIDERMKVDKSDAPADLKRIDRRSRFGGTTRM
ncbi:MAG: hypothetical protein Q9221_006147 [Calogaya cf. arnoldii]